MVNHAVHVEKEALFGEDAFGRTARARTQVWVGAQQGQAIAAPPARPLCERSP